MPTTYKRSYPWAANPQKLGEAINDLEQQKKLDSSTVINEETVKARYVVRKGAFKTPSGIQTNHTESADESNPPEAPVPTGAAALPAAPAPRKRVRVSSNKKTATPAQAAALPADKNAAAA